MRFSFAACLTAVVISLTPLAAEAATAIVTTSLNLRTGPGTQYAVLGTIPNGMNVSVAGCTAGYGWCRVGYAGIEGWAASRYIAIAVANGYTTSSNFGTSAAAVGIPLIAGVIIGSAISEDRWHDRRNHWHDYPRPHPRYMYGPGDRWKPYR